jgi:NADPH-dependent 2,4-dienoyl-CoA reductase/sulfur reductase-like enzyme/rhodanese-related sulfurtransferase
MACGPKTAARARRCDPHARITIVEQGTTVSEGSCGLPYYVGGQVASDKALLIRTPKYFKEVSDIDVLTGTRATAIHRDAHELEVVTVATGVTSRLPYDKLIIATGATPVQPASLAGKDLNGVFTLTKIADANAIVKALGRETTKKAVVIGAGLIGIESAEAFRSRGLDVSLVEALPHALPALLDPEMSLQVEKELATKGVNLFLGQRVLGLEGDSEGAVRRVVTEHATIEADIVILALGYRPNVELARQAGLVIGATGGLAVNEYMQTSDPDVYAGGDCVENTHRVTGAKILAPMGSTANKHGRIIGTNVTGGQDAFPGVLGTAIVKVFDLNVSRVGLSESEARTAGFDPVTALAPGFDRASYYPGAQMITVKLIADSTTGRVLGGQITGKGEVARRADVLVTTISLNGTVDDIANLDLAYSPPFNGAMDVLHHAANTVRNKRAGQARSVSAAEVNQRISAGEDFILLDVRSQQEWNDAHIEACQCRLLPLNKLLEEVSSLPKDARIVTLCRTSIRAYQAQRMLEGEGFTDVRFMDGSIVAWPYAVVCGPGK